MEKQITIFRTEVVVQVPIIMINVCRIVETVPNYSRIGLL
jgi:hypothetical protein